MEETAEDVIARLVEVQEKIRAMEEERDALKAEVEELKAQVFAELDAKTSALENELAKLRADRKALQKTTV